LMTGGDEFRDDRRANPAGRSRDKYTHGHLLIFRGNNCGRSNYPSKVVKISYYNY
jgi:hypothetical protein